MVLVLFIILVVAAVVVFVVLAVKPKRVRFRAGLGKITFPDFEADAGNPVEPVVIPSADQPKDCHRGAAPTPGLTHASVVTQRATGLGAAEPGRDRQPGATVKLHAAGASSVRPAYGQRLRGPG